MPTINGEVIAADGDDVEDLMIFPLTDIDDGADNNNDPFRENLDNDAESGNSNRFKPRMTLKQRRRSLLSATGLAIPSFNFNLNPSLSISEMSPKPSPVLSPLAHWKKAVRRIRLMKDPWEGFHLEELPTETATRHRYNGLKKQWVVDTVSVKIEKEPFNHGAMRTCYRLKKLSSTHAGDWTQQAHNYVAKSYMEKVNREVYFEDVRLQMDAKLWGEEYNRHRPPKKVDILQMSILEFKSRPDCPLFHLEHFIDGQYTKYNSNSGFVEESLRLTPQAFSHFTFERSSHKMIVVDVQGVGDLWTDPQIHTSDGSGYGDGNLGTRGMALFFHSHICNSICESLGLSTFDLAPSEKNCQKDFIKQQTQAQTRVRGVEEMCQSVSPTETFDFTAFFNQRTRTISSASSALSGNVEDDSNSEYSGRNGPEDEPMSVDTTSSPSPSYRRHRQFLSESDDSASATATEEEERMRFHMASKMLARPSSVAFEMDLRGLQDVHRLGDSILGQIHHDLAIYHEIGRFSGQLEPFDAEAVMFHEQQAAELGVKDAIVTLANIFLGMPHDSLSSVTVADTTENRDRGIEYMLMAAHAGDRAAMLYMAKAYETGNGLGGDSFRSYKSAVEWYEKAASMTQEDDCGEFDATMDDPVYQIKAAMAQLYIAGGYGLEKDPSYAGDLFTEAAEGATTAMKGRIANKYYALAEEAWAQIEE